MHTELFLLFKMTRVQRLTLHNAICCNARFHIQS